MKGEPRPRLRENPSRLLWLHQSVGYCRFAHCLLLHPKPACLGFWHVGSSCHLSPLGTRTKLVPSAPEGAPYPMPALRVPARLLTAKASGSGIRQTMSPDGCQLRHRAGVTMASVGWDDETWQAAQVPLVICLQDPSQCHALQTHSTSPHCGKEFKGKGGK